MEIILEVPEDKSFDIAHILRDVMIKAGQIYSPKSQSTRDLIHNRPAVGRFKYIIDFLKYFSFRRLPLNELQRFNRLKHKKILTLY
jgi:hypothetical protein